MRAIYIDKAGGFDVLKIREVEAPKPGRGEVAIAVKASGVNFADILARQGIYPDCPPYPCVVGYEVAGTVSAVGEGVDQSWLGKQVMALTDFKGYAEVAVAGTGYVWEKPSSLSFEEAVAIPLNYISAWALLVGMGGLKQGESVLLHNVGGGVGLAALQIAKHIGATVIGTASRGKHEFLKQQGCDHSVDYTTGDWAAEVMRLTGGKGVELAIDPLGGANWKKSYSVLRKTGRLGMFGIMSASKGSGIGAKLNLLKVFVGAPFFHPGKLIPGNRGVYGVNIHGMYEESGKFGEWMSQILGGLAQGWVKPHVDKVFRFDQVGEAHAYIEARKNIGKVLLVP